MALNDVENSPGHLITVDGRGRTNLAKADACDGQYVGRRHDDGTITLTPTTPTSGT